MSADRNLEFRDQKRTTRAVCADLLGFYALGALRRARPRRVCDHLGGFIQLREPGLRRLVPLVPDEPVATYLNAQVTGCSVIQIDIATRLSAANGMGPYSGNV